MKVPPERQTRSKNIAGPRIRQARTEFRSPLTQDQLAGKLAADGIQLDRVAITKIETGTRGIMDFELRGIARALRIDVNWLLGITESAQPSKPNNKEPQ
jgi:hypothetical protein